MGNVFNSGAFETAHNMGVIDFYKSLAHFTDDGSIAVDVYKADKNKYPYRISIASCEGSFRPFQGKYFYCTSETEADATWKALKARQVPTAFTLRDMDELRAELA